jgi:hypothetical protein
MRQTCAFSCFVAHMRACGRAGWLATVDGQRQVLGWLVSWAGAATLLTAHQQC